MRIIGEYYHIYNRGAHKAPIFNDGTDYWRFMALLFVANSTKRVRFHDLKQDLVFSYERGETLVEIIAYCLMPNHFHILIREKREDGIGAFIHKICTAYSMYYNLKYEHSGTIIQGIFKSKHVDTDEYLRYLIQYIHLNPFSIEVPNLNKLAKSEYFSEAVAYSKKYEYSSYKDFIGEKRAQNQILTKVPQG